MARQTPPLEAIEAFLAVAEQGGVRAAADVLALSPSATSRRIASLEAFLGTPLFDRTDQGLKLTSGGRRYYEQVEPAVRAIGRASVRVDTATTRITIATSHSVATNWLMPRAASILRDTGLYLDILPTRDPNVLRSGEAQFALWGAMEADDFFGEPIVNVQARPVTAPRLFDGRPAPQRQDLIGLPLLAPREPKGIWQRWLAQAGLSAEPGQVLEHATLALTYEAAAAGMGAALAIPMLCERQLEDGRLVACGPALSVGERYVLYRMRRRLNATPAETRWIHWLRREAALSVKKFEDIT
ncbi:LysR family transcriptional regulator [Novosphingobium soli]